MVEFWQDAFNTGPVGVIMMSGIIALGVFSFVIFIERFFVLYLKASVDKSSFIAGVKTSVQAGDLNSAVNYCNDRRAPLNEVVKAGLIAVMNRGSEQEVQTAMDVAALREIPKIERRTPFLPLFANIATLIGLMTTIYGLIGAFKAVEGLDPAEKAAFLGTQISLAMNGTFLGLTVAIPTLLASALLTSKTQRILDDVQEVSVEILNLILSNRDKFPSKK